MGEQPLPTELDIKRLDGSPYEVRDDKGNLVMPFDPNTLEVIKYTKVDLKREVIINGLNYGSGKGRWVPTEAESLWRDSLED